MLVIKNQPFKPLASTGDKLIQGSYWNYPPACPVFVEDGRKALEIRKSHGSDETREDWVNIFMDVQWL